MQSRDHLYHCLVFCHSGLPCVFWLVPLIFRFQAFDLCYRDITTLFEAWDRTTGSIYISESEKSELEQDVAPVQPTKKGQVGHKKGEKEREKEKEREREREKEKSKEVKFGFGSVTCLFIV